jgi:hypothetical protein
MMKPGLQESAEQQMAAEVRLQELTGSLEAFFESAGSVVVALS